MINGSLNSSHLDESNDYYIIKIGSLLAEIYQFEVFIAVARTYYVTVNESVKKKYM